MRNFSTEITYKTARSGGSGGQNVNKVETMVEAFWHVSTSQYFLPEEKDRIIQKLDHRINKDGYLIVKSTETRSQLENKNIARGRLMELVSKALIIPKKRKATKPTKASIEKRLESKKKESLKKQLRKKNY